MALAMIVCFFSVKGTDLSDFAELGLAGPLLKSIKREGFTAPTPIQSISIPPLLKGADLMGIAHTGGGKTAAFSLPLLHKLLQTPGKPGPNRCKALILAPTRELAQQIGKCILEFSRGTKVTTTVIAGGLPYGPQIQKLRRGVDVLIATPGRLMDHLRSGAIGFEDTSTYVLDEADRMLDMGFINDVMSISNSLPEGHQTVLFSATMSPKIKKLSRALLDDPVHVEIEQKTTVAETIDHKMMSVARGNKRALLFELLTSLPLDKTLVFARTKRGADRLAKQICGQDIAADAIHGDKRQRQREKILKNFRNGKVKVLVATDLAARGIDVDGITHVINFDLPMEPENYVHRVGRTGRAGKLGTAISFCDMEEVVLLRDIERLIDVPIEVDESHAYHVPVPSAPKAGAKKKPGRKRRGGKPGAHSKKVSKQATGKKRGGASKQGHPATAASDGKRRRFKKRPARAKQAA